MHQLIIKIVMRSGLVDTTQHKMIQSDCSTALTHYPTSQYVITHYHNRTQTTAHEAYKNHKRLSYQMLLRQCEKTQRVNMSKPCKIVITTPQAYTPPLQYLTMLAQNNYNQANNQTNSFIINIAPITNRSFQNVQYLMMRLLYKKKVKRNASISTTSIIPILSSHGLTIRIVSLCGLSMHSERGLVSAKYKLKKVKGICVRYKQQYQLNQDEPYPIFSQCNYGQRSKPYQYTRSRGLLLILADASCKGGSTAGIGSIACILSLGIL